MFVGTEDQIVDLDSSRWLHKQIKTVKFYKEYYQDHFSFNLAKDLSYFSEVLDLIGQYNPVTDANR